jgi:hypothetical protein
VMDTYVKFWIIWNPDSDKPPQARYSSEAQANAVAQKMALQHPGDSFFVLEATGLATLPKTASFTKLKSKEELLVAKEVSELKEIAAKAAPSKPSLPIYKLPPEGTRENPRQAPNGLGHITFVGQYYRLQSGEVVKCVADPRPYQRQMGIQTQYNQTNDIAFPKRLDDMPALSSGGHVRYLVRPTWTLQVPVKTSWASKTPWPSLGCQYQLEDGTVVVCVTGEAATGKSPFFVVTGHAKYWTSWPAAIGAFDKSVATGDCESYLVPLEALNK